MRTAADRIALRNFVVCLGMLGAANIDLYVYDREASSFIWKTNQFSQARHPFNPGNVGLRREQDGALNAALTRALEPLAKDGHRLSASRKMLPLSHHARHLENVMVILRVRILPAIERPDFPLAKVPVTESISSWLFEQIGSRRRVVSSVYQGRRQLFIYHLAFQVANYRQRELINQSFFN